MASAFRQISGLVEVDFPWRAADPKVLRHPIAYDEPRHARIVFHESVHYWQQLGQGYMTKLAEEDWERLLDFEAHDARPQGGARRSAFVRRHPGCGFSAQDLHESLARFWDVHVIGPHRLLEMDFDDPKRAVDEFFKDQYFALKKQGMIVHPEHGGYSNIAFDMAMDAAAGNYARPYKYVRERCNPAVTGVVFPLGGHCALQTDEPVEVFLKVIEAAARALERLPRQQAIHDLWRACYSTVKTLALRAAGELGLGQLTGGAAVMKKGPLEEHPVYRWIYGELERGRVALQDTQFAEALARTFGNVPEGIRGALAVDMCLCCPGDTTHRSVLIEWLAPPCVSFPDGKHWSLPEVYRRQLVPHIDDMERMLSEERRQVASDAFNVNERWQAFRRAMRGY